MRRDPKLWLGVVALTAIVGVVLFESERPSPGPLTRTHAAVPGLDGLAGCKRCHGAVGETMADACGQCHREIEQQLARRDGFHGTRESPSDCARCHVEHHGASVALVDARVFAIAGVADLHSFEHDFVDFRLTGRHDALACKQCHANADQRDLEGGEKRFLGQEQRCTACHDDPHGGRFVRACEQCHGQDHPFDELANFVHTAELPLTGAHAGIACGTCHPKEGERSVESLGSSAPQSAPRRCQDCHASPHDAQFLAGVGRLTNASADACCSACHAVSARSFSGSEADMPRALHAASGFALEAPHARASCDDCHGERAPGAPFERRPAARSASDCAACHDDPHRGQFDDGATPSACANCHAQDHFAPSTFDAAAHARVWPLEGAHARVACTECHAGSANEARVFRGASSRCEACHDPVHGSSFEKALARRTDEARALGGTCALCHEVGSFTATNFGAAEHDAFTSFALRGAHARAECTTCHAQRAAPDEHGRSFGRVEERFPGPPSLCSSCHGDPHAGAFDRPEQPRRVEGRASCARCHSEDGFEELAEPFDHARWTSFALEGAHSSASCEACHPNAAAGGAARTWRLARDSARHAPVPCSQCHADVHDGAFARHAETASVPGEHDCVRCHGSTSFSDVDRESFDHALWTSFALEGAHARTACEACHVPSAQRDASGRSFGRAAGASCAQCHSDPHVGQFARDGATDCARCHAGSDSFADLAFDHARDARFALDADHAALDCSACHRPSSLSDGRRAVRYKPLGTRCIDCHAFERRPAGSAERDPRSAGGGGQ